MKDACEKSKIAKLNEHQRKIIQKIIARVFGDIKVTHSHVDHLCGMLCVSCNACMTHSHVSHLSAMCVTVIVLYI